MDRSTRWLIRGLAAANIGLIAFVALTWKGRPDGAGAPPPSPSSALAWLDPASAARAATLFGSSERITPIVRAVERITPSIVSISAVVTQVVRAANPYFDDFFNRFLPYWEYQEKVPTLGSGLVVSSDGYIVTNYHVVEGASAISITLPDGREIPAELIDADTYVDIAVLKVQGAALPEARLGQTDDLKIGEWVLAIGNPFGAFQDDPHPSVSIGVVSATNRFFRPDVGYGRATRVYQDMIQTDAAINPGNSGGPLVNIDGEAIGINTFIFSKSGGSQGIGFAIPIERVRAVYAEVRQHGRVRTLWLDFQTRTLTRGILRQLGLPDTLQGAIVWDISANGPAARANLRLGDIIVRADRKTVRSNEDLYAYFITLQVGQRVVFEIVRDGQRMTVQYTVEEGN